MNSKTNKFHRDLQHRTKKEIDDMKKKRTIESIKNDLENLNVKHDIVVANLKYINTEISLLQAELDTLVSGKEASPLEDINACAKMLGIIQ